IYLTAGGQETLGVFGATVVRLALSTLVIGPATFVMGGTLSAAARAVTSSSDQARGNAAWLYGLNTLGAVAAALLSACFLLESLANRATLGLPASLNLLNAAAALWLSRRWRPISEPAASRAEESTAKPGSQRQRKAKKNRDEWAAPSFSDDS